MINETGEPTWNGEIFHNLQLSLSNVSDQVGIIGAKLSSITSETGYSPAYFFQKYRTNRMEIIIKGISRDSGEPGWFDCYFPLLLLNALQCQVLPDSDRL